MEREVTGLYLSGHPMDEYRNAVRGAGAVGIGDILADFTRDNGNIKFADDQQIIVAGVIESVKTKPTRNNTLMAYLTLDDGSGSIEMLAFQRIIDESGGYMQVNTPVIVAGRLSARDDKEPQIVVNTLRPIMDILRAPGDGGGAASSWAGARDPGSGIDGQGVKSGAGGGARDGTLYVKLQSESCPEYERLKLIHMMFPGSSRMVIHFSETKKSVGAKCLIHDALVNELSEMLGAENVVVR
jgi:DNA polymerase-3 subunit alpha